MPNWLAEFLYVLALSRRTQWALFMGVIFYIAIDTFGSYLLSNFELHGHFKALEIVISEKILRKYDKLALITLLSFWFLAVKYYLKDRKRL
ncbi:hypothetical protein L2725_17490 [Shewanella corallii]|uniref:Uncharacterized protein n=1 Tax=Shewanella corallii TaxID=560080 RepID=A0ABT0NAR9_9GAMM|nr:hypothetical protein [Shewanella corallii]MCL2915551.1 hypothetical protein [Shewanella corallii]